MRYEVNLLKQLHGREIQKFLCLIFRRDRPNAKCLPFWVRINCDNTKSLEFICPENELETPYIMEKLPSHQINNKTNLCWDLNSAIP